MTPLPSCEAKTRPADPTPEMLPPLIAIVGSDGSGKSTVGAMLLDWMRESRDTQMCHLGKQSGNIGRAVKRLPFIGKKADRKMVSTARAAREDAGPNAVTALIIYILSMRRVRRFRRMMSIRSTGVAILTDRYPQAEIPGPMDGPGLVAETPRSAIARLLGHRERRHYNWMASHRPDLVIRLNVDLETAVERKPDHRYTSLKTKVETVSKLTFNGAPVVDIDSTRPLAEVLAQAKMAISAALITLDAGSRFLG